jgi:hypothetical protein
MTKKVASGLAVTATATALVVMSNLPTGLTVTTQIVQVQNERTSFVVESAGDDRYLLVAAGYPIVTGRAVVAVATSGVSLVRLNQGRLDGVGALELWGIVNPPLGTLAVTISLTDDFDAEVAAMVLQNVDQSNSVAGAQVAIGKLVPSTNMPLDGGDATALFVMTVPPDRTLATPAGFDLLRMDVGGKARLSIFLDDDHSEASANLTFSNIAHFGAIAVGINVAP